jgi:cobalt-zinc-cadmium efflux system membrane fusion protein
MAIGVVWAPPELLKHIAIGQPIAIGRYGLRRSQMPGTVLSIGDNPMPSPDGTLTVPVLFRLGSGQTWYPGTNCEVEFPIGVGKAFHLPSTAVLHEGSREYVFKELGSGEYAPQSVAIIDESENSAEVLGNLKPSDRIVARGAILLKPILSVLLNQPQAPEGPAQNR